MTVQFDTGSAIVYVLTDRCDEHCNTQTKFKVPKPGQNGAAGSAGSGALVQVAASDDGGAARLEYGYGSGYINGFLADERMCFAEDPKAGPCVGGVKILEADQASGVEQDRFAGIIGLAPKSSEEHLRAFIAQVTEINRFSTED